MDTLKESTIRSDDAYRQAESITGPLYLASRSGEWVTADKCTSIRDKEGRLIANARKSGMSAGIQRSNARLIASAPKLFDEVVALKAENEALKAKNKCLRAQIQEEWYGVNGMIEKLIALKTKINKLSVEGLEA
jgi:hypothetical protein